MRVALLGCGKAAGTHARGLRGAGGKRVALWFASRDRARAQAYAERFGGAGHFGSYDEAIASPSIDVVAVLVPPHEHLRLTLDALAAGKDVILEKPPLLRAADFDLVEAAAARTGKRVFVAENYHYKPLSQAIRDNLDAVGEVLFVHVNAVKRQHTEGWRDDPALAGGGALYEGGIHWVNFMGNLGLTIQRVTGFRPAPRGALERSMLVNFEYAEGAIGTLLYSWEVPSPLRGLRISRVFGRRGAMAFETNGLFLALSGGRTRLLVPGLRDIQGYRAMFADFVAAWERGGEAQMTLARARQDLALVEAAYLQPATDSGGPTDGPPGV